MYYGGYTDNQKTFTTTTTFNTDGIKFDPQTFNKWVQDNMVNNKTNNKNGDDDSMQTLNLYLVYMIDDEGKFLIDGVSVIASNDEEAKFNAGVYDLASNSETRLVDQNIIVKKLGEVRIKDNE